MIWAAVPLKRLDQAKGRLAGLLSPQQRRHLVLAMLHDVLGTLLAAPIDRVLLVSRDPTALALARSLGAATLDDSADNLNGALELAAVAASAADAAALLVIPGDLPLLHGEDIVQLIAPLSGGEQLMTIAPSRDGGTSALCLRPPQAIPFRFGPDSFRRHLAEAHRYGLPYRIYRAPSATLDDVDTPEDLARLARQSSRGATAHALSSLLG